MEREGFAVCAEDPVSDEVRLYHVSINNRKLLNLWFFLE